MPARENFWGIPHEPISPEIYLYPLLGLCTVILVIRFFLKFRVWWQVGIPEKRWDNFILRTGRLIKYALIQTKVMAQRYPGVMHIALAWGFFVFFVGTALATIDADFYKILTGNYYLVYKFILDIFTVVFLIGVVLAAYRRYIQKPSRLTLSTGFTYSLILITTIVLSGLIIESLRLAIQQPEWAFSSPAGWLFAQLFIAIGVSETTLIDWHLILWFFHWILVGLLIVTLPVSTLVHVVTSPLNVFFSKIDRKMGELAKVKTTKENQPIYVSTHQHLTWKQLLDGDACTECGRCQDACPAYLSNTPLSPKEYILSIGKSLHANGSTSGNGTTPILVGDIIKDAVLWACTTCGACVQECPVLIEHVDAIVDMRRYLIMEGRVDDELQDALANLGRYGNSFGKSARARSSWARRLKPKIKDARKEPVKYLWFVGDYASYSSTLTDSTKLTSRILQEAEVDFGILYEAENNSGNDARRVGEEGLFEQLVEQNIDVLEKCTYQKILTTDPHTYNTLKHEYPKNGYSSNGVIHYAELLDELFSAGKLKVKKKLNYRVTFHDPCYLARYNNIVEPPRRVIEHIGCQLVEMPRHKERTFCCGAGGGRIWMEDDPQIVERPAEIRLREAASLPGITIFIVACPKDLVMFQDAVKTTGLEDRIEVKDLIELVGEAIELSASEEIEA